MRGGVGGEGKGHLNALLQSGLHWFEPRIEIEHLSEFDELSQVGMSLERGLNELSKTMNVFTTGPGQKKTKKPPSEHAVMLVNQEVSMTHR